MGWSSNPDCHSLHTFSYRAIAPSPAVPAMAGPVFAAGTKILNIEDMHFKHTFKSGGGGGGGGWVGTGLRLNNILEAE